MSSVIAVLDVDGTLVDSNYQHALAWYRAFRSLDVIFPVWRLHRLIGMGGDQLVTAIGGEDLERRLGDQARGRPGAGGAPALGAGAPLPPAPGATRERQVREVDRLIGEIALLPGARELLLAIKERGHRLVLASSGKKHHVEAFLDLLDARDIADAWTTSGDVEESKPAPDLLHVALTK